MAGESGNQTGSEAISRTDLIPRVIISAAAGLLLVLHITYPGLLPSDSATIALLIAVVLPWVPAFLTSAEFPGGWKFEFRRLERKTKQLQDELERTRQRVDDLVIASMSDTTFYQLRK